MAFLALPITTVDSTLTGAQGVAAIQKAHAIPSAAVLLDLASQSVARKPQTPRTFSGFGNSITAAPAGFTQAYSRASKGHVMYLSNEGVGGDTTAQMLARIASIPAETKLVTVMEATNDASTGVTVSVHTANMKLILETLISMGITPLLVLSPPKSDTSDTAEISAMNIEDWKTARELSILCFNPWDLYSDPYGFWTTGSAPDGTHPTDIVSTAVGEALWNAYDTSTTFFPLNRNNNFGLISNSLNMVDSNADNVPNGTSLVGGGSSAVSLGNTSLGIGNTFTFKVTNQLGYTDVTTSLVANSRYIFAVNMTVSHIVTGDGNCEMYIQAPSGFRHYVLDEGRSPLTAVFISLEFKALETGTYLIRTTANGTSFEFNISTAQLTLFSLDTI
jgi:hypothetical protein